MSEYHKIQTVWKRDPATNHKTLLYCDWSLPEFGYLADLEWIWTEKVDGTNIRVIWKDGAITFGGKTDAAQIPAKLLNRLNEQFLPLQDTFAAMFPDSEAVLYGEGHGAGIQKGGGNYSPTQEFVLFDVRVGPWWLQRWSVADVAQKLGLQEVPFIGRGGLMEMARKAADGFKSQWGDFLAEGIVARPLTELCTRDGHRLITKIKTKDFVKPPAQQDHPTMVSDGAKESDQ